MFQNLDNLPMSRESSRNGFLRKVEEATIPNCPPETAAHRAALLLGCYRKADCADPEVFATAAIAVLMKYPEDVVRKVTDPQCGIPATSKWVPTIAELRDACEAANAAAARIVQADARVKEQLDERERFQAMNTAERRKEFIGKWREQQARMWAASDIEDRPLDDLDSRKCQGVMKERVREALDAKLSRIAASALSTPVVLSDEALEMMGRGRG